MSVDYADTRISNFAIEYRHENEIVGKIVFACSYWDKVLVRSFKPKKGRQSRDTDPFTNQYKVYKK